MSPKAGRRRRWRAWLRGRRLVHEEYRLPLKGWPEQFVSRYELWELLDHGEDSTLLQSGDDPPVTDGSEL